MPETWLPTADEPSSPDDALGAVGTGCAGRFEGAAATPLAARSTLADLGRWVSAAPALALAQLFPGPDLAIGDGVADGGDGWLGWLAGGRTDGSGWEGWLLRDARTGAGVVVMATTCGVGDGLIDVLASAYPPLAEARVVAPEEQVGPQAAPAVARRPRATRRRPVPSDRRHLSLVRTITGRITPKSIVATPSGRFFAQNVTYLHTIAVYDRRYRRIATIDDRVPRSMLRRGSGQVRGRVRGAPVEAAVSADGRSVYVSQYSLFGKGFRNPGFDRCHAKDEIDRSAVYRVDVASLRIVDACLVGEVPKFLASSPDGRLLLVANWCSMDVSVVDLARGREVARIPVGINPRGIAFSRDGATAWVSVVGERRIAIIDLRRMRVRETFDGVGLRPRHLVMGRGGRALYVSVEGYEIKGRRDGMVLELDSATGEVLGRVDGLLEPRTAVLAPDGRSLYVVDYLAGRLVKIDTSTMRVLQSVKVGHHPIGVAVDAATSKVWVAGYTGTIWVLADR